MSLVSRLEGRLGSKDKVDQLVKKHENLEENLKEIMTFLQTKETTTQADATHIVLEEYADWWRPKSKKLVIVEEQLQILARYIVELHDMGVPLTLAEQWSNEAKLAQDLLIRGSADDTIIGAAELVDDQHPLMLLMGQVMGQLYGEFITSRPEGMFLDAAFFDGSGKSEVYGVMETNIRIVWQSIVVTRDRAQNIRDIEKKRLQQDDSEGITQFRKKAEELHQENNPDFILPDKISNSSKGNILMPLNDRVKPPPQKVPEGRPLRPMYMKRFHYAAGGTLQRIEVVATPENLDGEEWVKFGSTRLGEGTPVTNWKQPEAFQGRSGRQGGSGARPQGVQQTRSGGRVSQIRSAGGSPGDDVHRRGPRDPNKAVRESTSTSTREFLGTPAEFKQILIDNFGDDGIAEAENSVSWTGPNGQKVEFTASTQRVYITGRELQVRTMVDRLQKHLSAAGEKAKSVVSGQTAARTSTQARSAAAKSAASYAPSEVHRSAARPSAPSTAAASVASALRAGGGKATENTRRRVTKEFMSEGDGELDLAVDDVVVILEDPVESRHNYHRWVKGVKESSKDKECGWFPLTHTEEIPES
mmetsp:Transcript_9588/g.21415  ORF Transcript_9588/g.21415 Transcript_9588/m.21415 type:complete len:587 (-) Transcript_9588:201-1961(-)